MTIGILGGGVSGLSLAYFLDHEHGIKQYEILEKHNEAGGLCTTFDKNGFKYDLGGHIMFSSHKEILDFEVNLMGENLHKKRRSNKIWFKKRFVKYPFENGLHALDKEDIFECLRDYVVNSHPKPTNVKEWFYYTFGTSISEKYMLPYNEKIWKIKPEEMGMGWVERIPKPPMEDVIKSAVGIETEGYTHQLYFYYPIHGGFQSVTRTFESKLKPGAVLTSKDVQAVYKENNKWVIETKDSKHTYETLVSTLSIFKLIKVLKENIPNEVIEAVNNLRYNSLAVVLVGLNKVKHSDLTAVYVPEKESLAHRYCFSAGFSDNLSPPGCSSIFAEITANGKKGFEGKSDQEIIDNTTGWLIKEGFIEKNDICETDIKHIKYAYPVYDSGYNENTKIIYDYFDKIGICLLGRFAQFIYMNSDVCILHAKKLATSIQSKVNA
jgi:protoporphyrinogen oxidase